MLLQKKTFILFLMPTPNIGFLNAQLELLCLYCIAPPGPYWNLPFHVCSPLAWDLLQADCSLFLGEWQSRGKFCPTALFRLQSASRNLCVFPVVIALQIQRTKRFCLEQWLGQKGTQEIIPIHVVIHVAHRKCWNFPKYSTFLFNSYYL